MSFLLIYPNLHLQAKREGRSSMGRTKEQKRPGHGWRVVASLLIMNVLQQDHSLTLLCTHHPQVCYDHGSYFSQWNLVEVDMPEFHKWSVWNQNLICLTLLPPCIQKEPPSTLLPERVWWVGTLSTKVRCEWEIKLSYVETFRFGGFMCS